MRVFTREQFHELVWSKPITALAKEFGLSDVALHKICRKHDVPTPPPGWWAKQHAGKKVKITPLPKLKAGISDKIVITGGELRREPDAIAAVREQARVIASSDLPQTIETPPIVARTIAALRKGKRGPTGLVGTDGRTIRCEIAPASIDRLERALGRIVAAVAQQGFVLNLREKDVCFAGADEEIGFSIVEVTRRIKHELTEKEQAEQDKWQRKRERDIRAGGWSDSFFTRPHFPEWDSHPTGQLSFELEAYVPGSLRRTFRDGKVHRLEDMAGEIAVGIAVVAAAKTEARLQREAAQRHEEEQRRLREHTARAKHIEERRSAGLDQIIGELERLELLQQLQTRIAGLSAAGPRVTEFRRWIEGQLEQIGGGLTGEALEEWFSASRLFGDDDDHAFRFSPWG
jgi:hypothetical protein